MRACRSFLKHKWFWIYLFIMAVVAALNIIAWNSTAFCDAYIANIFPIWVNTYGRLTDLVPFSVGEIMLGLAVVLMALTAVLWIPALIWKKLRHRITWLYTVRGPVIPIQWLFECAKLSG